MIRDLIKRIREILRETGKIFGPTGEVFAESIGDIIEGGLIVATETTEDIFSFARKTTKIIMAKMLEILGPPRSELYEAARHLILAGGKHVRPNLVILGAKAVGGDASKVLALAAGSEFGHVASLIHDDIIDRDKTRRGVPAVHVKYGVSVAILAGDLLIVKAFQSLIHAMKEAGIPPETIVKVLELACESGIRIDEGEFDDVTLRIEDMDEEMYIDLVEKKTAEAMKTSLMVGALVGGGTEKEVKILGEYGRLIGIAYQIKDDILGIYGVSSKTGKPARDIHERRKNYLLIYAYNHARGEDKKFLDEYLKKKTVTEEDVRRVLEIIEKTGALEAAVKKIHELSERAKDVLKPLKETRAKRVLLNVADALAERTY